jgi:peroxiredoxin Q/BCP
VVGVSGDTPESQKLFKTEKDLPFTLLADTKGQVAKAFGIKVTPGGTFPYKDASGQVHPLKRGVTIARYHVVIDKQGNIADIAPVSKAGDDAKRVCEVVEKLEKK